MNRRTLILGVTTILLLCAAIWWWSRPNPPPPAPLATSPTPASTSSPLPQVQNQDYSWQGDTYAPLPADREPGYDPSLPQWAEWRRRRALDPKFEWKMPVNFYGKVVDQNDQPVQGVKVRFQWTDMSPSGTTEKFTETDAQGSFSLNNEKGKRLLVFVSKDGYHAADKGRASFEYAAFFDPHYIEPDPNKPVVFELIKKQEAQPLVTAEKEIKFSASAATVQLDDTTLNVRLLANQIKPDQPWSMQITASGGGLQVATDEFPVKAPTEGYESSVTIDRKSPKPSGWRGLYEGGVLYVKTAKGYGRVEIKMLAGDNKARVKTYLNPSGSRNLESE